MRLGERLKRISSAIYKAEQLVVTLIRGRIFFVLGRFVRHNGSLSAITIIALFVTATNLWAKYDDQTLVGYYEEGTSQQEKIAIASTDEDDGLGLGDTDDAIAQLALGTDIETRKEVPKKTVTSGDGESLVTDSTDLVAYGTEAESGELDTEIQLYTVEKGDTLNTIARNEGISINTLLWANDIADMNDIAVGDTLFILPISGVKYKVRASDTIQTIAAKYKADQKEILAFNELPANGELKSGQEIIIPGGQIAPPPRPKPVTVASSPSLLSTRAEISTQTKGRFAHPLPGSTKTQGIHATNAVDLAAPMGTKIYAAEKGKVTKVLNSGWGGGYGKHVVITHDNGMITLYAHLSRLDVKKGQKVKKGQVVGRVGSTGRSTGPHLHFEIRGGPRNPF